MENIKKDLKNILVKLEDELHALSTSNNSSALIKISAEFKELQDVIQYFEGSIDSIKTRNEAFQEIFKDTIRDIIYVKEKMIDGIIDNKSLKTKINELFEKLEKLSKTPEQKSMFQKFKNSTNDIITPKIALVSLALILLMSVFIFMPDKTLTLVEKVSPIIKSSKLK